MRSDADDHWTDHAICRGADPDLFHPIGYAGAVLEAQQNEAKAICGHCPVTADCLGWALRAGEPDGIWGGTTPEERRYLRRRATVSRPSAVSTNVHRVGDTPGGVADVRAWWPHPR